MKKKRFGRRLRALLAVLVLTISMLGTAAYADEDSSTGISDSANGVARLFVVLTTTYYDYSLTSDGSINIEPVTVDVAYATGSAFGIGETVGEETDTFVTNRHVVTDDDYEVSEIWLLLDSRAVEYSYDTGAYYNSDGTMEYYSLLSYDIDTSLAIRCDIEYLGDEEYPDIAVVKARSTDTGRSALALLSSDTLSSGDTVWAIGYPGDSDATNEQSTDTGYKYNLAADISDATVTTGIVSRITTSALLGDTNVIQHTANISSGNSGGPLLNDDGAVVGINTYTVSGDDEDYYSVAIDYIIDVCEDNGIAYCLWTEEEETGGIPIIPIAAAVIVIIVVIVIIIAVSRKKKKTQPEPEPEPQMQPEPFVQEVQPAPAPQAQSIPGDSGFRIQCTAGTFAGRRFAIVNQLRIGRDPNKNDVVYPSDTKGISGVHCVIGVTNGRITLMDLGSTYGTFLSQGQRLAANQPVTLNVGDTFMLGSKDETFVITRKGGI